MGQSLCPLSGDGKSASGFVELGMTDTGDTSHIRGMTDIGLAVVPLQTLYITRFGGNRVTKTLPTRLADVTHADFDTVRPCSAVY